MPARSVAARRLPALVGGLVGLAGFAFVVRTLVGEREQVLDAVAHARPGSLAVAFLFAALGMTGIGLAWRASLRVLGSEVGLLSTLRGYFVGQLGKYVPGGVWAFIGLGEWARREGIGGVVAYSSVLLSVGSTYLAALLLAATSLPLSGLVRTGVDGPYMLVLLLLPLGFTLVHPRVVACGLRVVRQVTRREVALQAPPWGASTLIVLRQVPSWILIGATNLTIASAFGAHGDPINIIAATAISWVVGFLALPVPGGIGVREAAFVALAVSLPSGLAAATAVTARLLFVAVDAIGAACTTALVARRRAVPGVGR